ncbi:MAG: hypothetical protein ACJ73S_08070 [Mycobacteriales bacterium]
MNRITHLGLVLAGLLGVLDLAALAAGGGDFPPLAVGIADMLLGLVTVVAVVRGWRGNRAAIGTAVAARLASALTALPAFAVDGVPAAGIAAATAQVALTLLATALLLPALRPRTAVTATGRW